MRRTLALQQTRIFALAAAVLGMSAPGLAVDEEAALALAKASKCTKCHSVDKKKDGPAYKETAAKYKGKADAVDKLYTHLTTNPKIKIDGKEEEHTGVKSTNEGDIKNLVAYILSR